MHFQDTSKRYAREALAASENITASDPDSIMGKDILSILGAFFFPIGILI